jgi:hypothetical protein
MVTKSAWTSNLLAAAADGLQIVYPSPLPPWVMFKPFISIHLTLFLMLAAFARLVS